MLTPCLSPALTKAGIKHAFFTREGGVSTGIYASLNGGQGSADEAALVAENRARMARYMGVEPGHLLSLHQVHSALCVSVETPWTRETRPEADAMASARPGLALGISTADCGPILFADPVARVVGAAHAGWKGAKGGVLEASLAAMEARGAKKSRIIAALGPMLSQTHYEVGLEFLDAFVEDGIEYAEFFCAGSRIGHPHFDLPGYITARLRKAGVGTIEQSGLCTYADEKRFYSYRRKTHRNEPDYGRMIAAIRL